MSIFSALTLPSRGVCDTTDPCCMLICSVLCVQVSPSAWVKLNPGVVGFYRVNYADPEDLARLCEAVSSGAMEAVDRLNVLDDLFR